MKAERKQLAFIGAVLAVGVISIFGYAYFSARNINIYNVQSTVYVVPETYVPEEQRININTASADELMTLEGIGETLAERIIEYRELNGRFESIYDLTMIEGISDSRIEKLKPYIKTE